MKKLKLIVIAVAGVVSANAQNINPGGDNNTSNYKGTPTKVYKADSSLPNWCIDVNLTGGILTQKLTASDPKASYLNAINSNVSALKFTKGMSYGLDAEVNYFFNKNRHWGVGTGVWYMMQSGTVTMDNFHVEYQATDKSGNKYRQLITANSGIQESLKITNFNIPLLLKYKTRFSKTLGFTADAGALLYLVERSTYSSNASFDYEAVYRYAVTDGKLVAEYPANAGASDLLITKKQYMANNPTSSVQNYFTTLRNQGNNVGLAVKPNNNGGDISYKTASIGFVVRPAISIYLSDKVALNLGAYYLYQNFKQSNSGNGKITDIVGDYNSVLNSVSSSANSSYGANVGLRFFLGKAKAQQEVAEAPEEKEEEEAVVTPTPAPVIEVEPAEEPRPAVNVNTPILFDLDKTRIRQSSYPILNEAVNQLKEDDKKVVEVHGYADNTGKHDYNKALSQKRASVVKTYLQQNGVNAKKIRTIGHGEDSPAASNATAEGRAQNRRAVMKLTEEGRRTAVPAARKRATVKRVVKNKTTVTKTKTVTTVTKSAPAKAAPVAAKKAVEAPAKSKTKTTTTTTTTTEKKK